MLKQPSVILGSASTDVKADEDLIKQLGDIIDRLKVKQSQNLQAKGDLERFSETLKKIVDGEKRKVNQHVIEIIEDFSRQVRDSGKRVTDRLESEYANVQTNLNHQLKDLESYEKEVIEVVAKLELLSKQVSNRPIEGYDIKFKPFDFQKKKIICELFRDEVFSEDTSESMESKYNDPLPPEEKQSLARSSHFGVEEEALTHGQPQSCRPRSARDRKVSVEDQLQREGSMGESSESRESLSGTKMSEKKYKRLYRFGKNGSEAGDFGEIWGIALNRRTNTLVICDSGNNRLQLSTIQGQHQRSIEFSNFPKPCCPYFVTVSEDDNIFFTDVNNCQVVVCNDTGNLLRYFGEGKIKRPWGIAVRDNTHKVYVVDNEAHCIHVFSDAGVFMMSLGKKGRGKGQFRSPRDVCIDSIGNVIVSDTGNHRIQVLDDGGKFLFTVTKHGFAAGQTGVAVDNFNNIYVCNRVSNAVKKYNPHGESVCRIDRRKDKLNMPTAVCVTSDGHVIVTDCEARCIVVFIH